MGNTNGCWGGGQRHRVVPACSSSWSPPAIHSHCSADVASSGPALRWESPQCAAHDAHGSFPTLSLNSPEEQGWHAASSVPVRGPTRRD